MEEKGFFSIFIELFTHNNDESDGTRAWYLLVFRNHECESAVE